jgi:hypothetical protein
MLKNKQKIWETLENIREFPDGCWSLDGLASKKCVKIKEEGNS